MQIAEAMPVGAAVWRNPGAPGSVEEVLLDPPGPSEVRVRVAAAGVCHSDLHQANGHLGGELFPTVLGHEGAGIVEAVGTDVAGPEPGQPVAFCFIAACAECRRCLEGRAALCERNSRASFEGTMLDGTTRVRLADGKPARSFLGIGCFAERCVVPARATVPLPPGLPLWQAALVGCAVVTGFGAVRNAAGVRAGESACVVGLGGVGLQVLAAARLAGAEPLVAVDRAPAKLELALARGATHAVDAGAADAARQIRKLTGGGADHAFEVVGRAETIRLAWDSLRAGGTAVVVGLAPVGVEAAVPAIGFISEKSLRGCFYGSGEPRREIPELARLAADGEIDVAGSVSHLAGLDGIEDAFGRMCRGEGARTVIVLDRELAGVSP